MPTTQVPNGLSPMSETTPESSPGPSPKRQCFQGSPAYGTIEASALGGLAARACEKCRASKRKCDKKLPFCDRCKRLNAKCHYIHDISNNVIPQGAQLVIYQPHSLSHDALLRGAEPLEGITAAQILSLISPGSGSGSGQGQHIDWRAVVNTYFLCVHSWYAVIHPRLFEQQAAGLAAVTDESDTPSHSHSHSDRSAKTVALLVAAMALLTRMRITDAGPQPIFDETYRTVKRLLSSLLLACAGDPHPDVEVVQCGALVALYEYGHGDAVTAYRTLSQAVVTARVLGIRPAKLAEGGTGRGGDIGMNGVEEEQSGGLWWGMFILEQFIHQDENARDFPFLLESPTRNTLLPETPPTTPPPSSNGTGTGSGVVFPMSPPSAPRHLSTNILIGTEKFGGFQLSAKTACLFHRALRIDKERDARPGKMPLVSTYADLDREIRESTLTLLGETLDWEAMLDCFAMLVSALFTLYMPYLSILENTLHFSSSTPASTLVASSAELSTAIAALRFACKMSTDISCKLNANFESTAPRSPALLCAPAGATCYLVIQAYAALRRIFPEERDDCEANIEEKFESLKLFSFRWGIAEKMMSQLEKKLNVDRNHYLQRSRLMPPPHTMCFDFVPR
ncbi:hypothetical protein GL218_05863 [Daldinia childiae]|uniref:uncharacterized protein n=1 Tax=Daldinia childiae TaxID=326645 RepID=UPI001445F2EA|nr:uncharacterized protein GL218_05863 [Daldinia childiae]KAF3058084.1 hypothetical protein GL218_05863 [Daldinia childiae]